MSANGCDRSKTKIKRPVELPARLSNLGKRLLWLRPGLYQITLIIPESDDEPAVYSITEMGKVEK